MKELQRLGADVKSTSDELVAKLVHLQITTLQRLRCEIFEAARSAHLVSQDDVIVQRQKRAIGPSLQSKLATDIATIVYHLRNRKSLPRTLLRNGKRSKQRYEQLKCQLSNKLSKDVNNTNKSVMKIPDRNTGITKQPKVVRNNNNTMAMVDENNHENENSGKKSEGSYCESAFHTRNETNTPKRAVDGATSMASIVGGGGVYNTPDVAAQSMHVAAHTDDTTIMQNCGTGSSVVTQSTAGFTACDLSVYNTMDETNDTTHKTPIVATDNSQASVGNNFQTIGLDLLPNQTATDVPPLSVVMREISQLKENLSQLHHEVQTFKIQGHVPQEETTLIYVKLSDQPSMRVNKTLLSSILHIPYLSNFCVRLAQYHVKLRSHLYIICIKFFKPAKGIMEYLYVNGTLTSHHLHHMY